VLACPRKALTQSEENGVILVNEELCDGCGWCVTSCKIGAIALDPKHAVRICDLCSDREGGPACIEWCPEDALELTTEEALEARKTAVAEGEE
jgi:Fe-S-cluster-containing hydrogenase component 2